MPQLTPQDAAAFLRVLKTILDVAVTTQKSEPLDVIATTALTEIADLIESFADK